MKDDIMNIEIVYVQEQLALAETKISELIQVERLKQMAPEKLKGLYDSVFETLSKLSI